MFYLYYSEKYYSCCVTYLMENITYLMVKNGKKPCTKTEALWSWYTLVLGKADNVLTFTVVMVYPGVRGG